MKNFRITVNGNIYDVQVEELGGVAPVAPVAPVAAAPVAPVAPAAPAQAAPAPAPAPAPAQAGAGEKVTAPMPGTILDIKVNVGDKVQANQVVAILEAMKMENEIVTPVAGTVTSVVATKSSSVNSGDVILTIA